MELSVDTVNFKFNTIVYFCRLYNTELAHGRYSNTQNPLTFLNYKSAENNDDI